MSFSSPRSLSCAAAIITRKKESRSHWLSFFWSLFLFSKGICYLPDLGNSANCVGLRYCISKEKREIMLLLSLYHEILWESVEAFGKRGRIGCHIDKKTTRNPAQDFHFRVPTACPYTYAIQQHKLMSPHWYSYMTRSIGCHPFLLDPITQRPYSSLLIYALLSTTAPLKLAHRSCLHLHGALSMR